MSRKTSAPALNEIILSWFLDNGYNAPAHLVSGSAVMKRGKYYKVSVGTTLIGIGSEIEFGSLVYKSIPSDVDMTQAIIYEFENPSLVETSTGQYYLSPAKRVVSAMCRADKFAIMQKNIRQTTYALNKGQVTGLLIEVVDALQ